MIKNRNRKMRNILFSYLHKLTVFISYILEHIIYNVPLCSIPEFEGLRFDFFLSLNYNVLSSTICKREALR